MEVLASGCDRHPETGVAGRNGQTSAVPDPSFGAKDLEHSPEYSGYSFLPDGRYAAGVWLADPEEAWEYVMMQKDYQHRIMICDRDDFAVLEMQEGQMLFPDVQTLEEFLTDARAWGSGWLRKEG